VSFCHNELELLEPELDDGAGLSSVDNLVTMDLVLAADSKGTKIPHYLHSHSNYCIKLVHLA
jgi:hypothetical protein